MRQETLLFVLDEENGKVLLAMKKVRFGAGKWNGVGGRVMEGETIERAAMREAQEEVGVTVSEKDLEKRAVIQFSFENKPEWSRVVHVFVASRWAGEPAETEEMAPRWFALDEIPFESMWVDDRFWLPRVLKGEKLDAAFHLNTDGSEILHQHIQTL